MKKSMRKRFISCLIVTCMLIFSVASATVSAETNTFVDAAEIYSGDTVHTLQSFESGNAIHLYHINFSTSSTLNVKLGLTAGYTDGSSGYFDIYLDNNVYSSGRINMNGHSDTFTFRNLPSGSHTITLWPDEYNKNYIIVGQVYYLT